MGFVLLADDAVTALSMASLSSCGKSGEERTAQWDSVFSWNLKVPRQANRTSRSKILLLGFVVGCVVLAFEGAEPGIVIENQPGNGVDVLAESPDLTVGFREPFLAALLVVFVHHGENFNRLD